MAVIVEGDDEEIELEFEFIAQAQMQRTQGIKEAQKEELPEAQGNLSK